jgi:hypothetical protein
LEAAFPNSDVLTQSSESFAEQGRCEAQGGKCGLYTSCQGTNKQGLCPGDWKQQCCVKKAGGGGGGGGGSVGSGCGQYSSSATSQIQGNDRVYTVVKILRGDLVDASAYGASPTDRDNSMEKSTACAFDRLRSAAAASGVAIKIASGFRTLARQNYFWRCYQTKSCNGGNLAARPGSSNHGRGIALDLNTNCGKQSGSRPNCGGSRVYQFLANKGQSFGFVRTVQSEPWHWEFRSGSPKASYT